jgi:aspartyl-tRNA(Asn)/glutamyl-tRNA(Gln) amidotransferase subunit B
LAAALAGDAARSAKVAANWVLGEVARWTNESGRDLAELPVSPASLAELIGLVESGGVTAANGKEVFAEMARSGGDARSIVASRGLATIEAGDELLAAAREAIAANPKAVEDYRAGKEAAIKFLVGKVMQQTHGRASPQKVLELLTSELAAK